MNEPQVIVIGGGPAGSTAACALSQAGLRVLLLEASSGIRAHVGESVLPGIFPVLERIGALEGLRKLGFGEKTGSTHHNWGSTKRWDLWFRDTDAYDHAWFVERERFDAFLLDHARAQGVTVLTETAARRVARSAEGVVVTFAQRGNEEESRKCRWVIDASGQSALLARQHNTREHIDGLRHRAVWAHYETQARLPAPRERQAWFVAEPQKWFWLFPLSESHVSIGCVYLHSAQEAPLELDAEIRGSGALFELVGDSLSRVGPVRAERDWSYRVTDVSGAGYRLIGDAAGFIDPVLSTGVFLSLVSAIDAADSIIRVHAKEISETESAAAYKKDFDIRFQDLLRMVTFYYKQALSKEDYFWESKRILMHEGNALRPQRAFLALTSGLVRNLAFDAAQERVSADRLRLTRGGRELSAAPEKLGFVCFTLSVPVGTKRAELFWLVEPRREAEPSLFRTPNFDLNCLAPRFDNDPIGVPELEPALRALSTRVAALDDRSRESLAAFFSRRRRELETAISKLPPEWVLEGVFGE